jgi:mevalonate kinase
MKLKDPLFYAKILLFGEYSIIEDSMGLSIPFDYYQGKFIKVAIDDDFREHSNKSLRDYCDYLQVQQDEDSLMCKLDLVRFKKDINEGLVFDSNIPQGFGVGSSGALVAAIYNKYGIKRISSGDKLKKNQITELKMIFSQLESFFHGKSSGIDPLICYLNIPLLIKSSSDIGTVGLPNSVEGEGAIFLLDSGSPGETQPLVNLFMEKLKQDGFRKMVKEEFVKYNDDCIQSFLTSDIKSLFRNLKNLSQFLFENFTPMIPIVFHKLWKEGLDSNAYYLKLCGSGGGGFILGFTQNLPQAKKVLTGYDLEVIHRF